MKKCNTCHREKPVSDFYLQKRRSGVSHPKSRCKACHIARMAKNREGRSESKREETYLLERSKRLMKDFGLSLEDYDRMLEEQSGVCKICKKPETSVYRDRVRQLAVDHDHATGEIRGLLCMMCNTRLGHFNNLELIGSLMSYLKIGVNA